MRIDYQKSIISAFTPEVCKGNRCDSKTTIGADNGPCYELI